MDLHLHFYSNICYDKTHFIPNICYEQKKKNIFIIKKMN